MLLYHRMMQEEEHESADACRPTMNCLCFFDGDRKTSLSEDMRSKLSELSDEKGIRFEPFELRRKDLLPCLGCMACYATHPGTCVGKDILPEIKRLMLRDGCIVVYLSPVIFGHYSSTIKNLIDKDGMYIDDFRSQISIGYGEDTDDEEASTFLDITFHHRGAHDIVHADERKRRFEAFVTRSLADNQAIAASLRGIDYLWGAS